MEPGQAISLAALIISAAALVRLLFADHKQAGEQMSSIDTKLDFVSNDVKDIKAEQRSHRDEIKEVRDLARHAQHRADAAHERIDSLEERIPRV